MSVRRAHRRRVRLLSRAGTRASTARPPANRGSRGAVGVSNRGGAGASLSAFKLGSRSLLAGAFHSKNRKEIILNSY